MPRLFRNSRYANVTATLALVVALGGTSYAAITLPKNSVGARQIKKNAVRSSEVRRNAVGSSEIKKNAIGTTKVRDRTLLAEDFRPGQLPAGPRGARGPRGETGARGPSNLRVAQRTDTVAVPTCAATTVTGCTNLLSRRLGPGNWLIQAKLTIDNNDGAAASGGNRCGLAVGSSVIDEARNSLGANAAVGENEAVALMAVMSRVAEGTVVGLRCTEQAGETLQTEDAKITALQVESVTGP